MAAGRDDLERRHGMAPMPVAALAVLVLGVCSLWSLCLPHPPRLGPAEHYDEVYFRPEWLVLATLLALPLVRIARWRITVGLAGLVLLASVALVVAVEGTVRIRAAGHQGPVDLVVAAAALQGLLFLVAVVAGARTRLHHRRMARLSRRVARLDPSPAPHTTWADDDVQRRS